MTTDTPTPRTDAFEAELPNAWMNHAAWLADFARTLERDLTACRAALRELFYARDAEAKARQRLDVALANQSDWQNASQDHLWTMVAVCKAESAARAILQSDEGETR